MTSESQVHDIFMFARLVRSTVTHISRVRMVPLLSCRKKNRDRVSSDAARPLLAQTRQSSMQLDHLKRHSSVLRRMPRKRGEDETNTRILRLQRWLLWLSASSHSRHVRHAGPTVSKARPAFSEMCFRLHLQAVAKRVVCGDTSHHQPLCPPTIQVAMASASRRQT